MSAVKTIEKKNRKRKKMISESRKNNVTKRLYSNQIKSDSYGISIDVIATSVGSISIFNSISTTWKENKEIERKIDIELDSFV